MNKGIISAVLFVSIVGLASAATIHVPGDYPGIQQAINAALGGDTILVAPGTYWESIDYQGKALTIRSVEGPRNTVIDAGDPSKKVNTSVVSFKSLEGPDSVLDGFTLKNGTGTFISKPTAEGYVGGGVVCYRASPTIKNNIITNNEAGFGGGVGCWADCTPVVINNRIENNFGYYGGGVQVMSFSGQRCYAHICNNMICFNTAKRGGGIESHNYESAPTVVNNTIYGNAAELNGGGVRTAVSHIDLINNILWNNTCDADKGPQLSMTAMSKVNVDHCVVMGGLDQVFKDGSSKLTWGDFNLDEAPMFVDPLEGDFHLSYVSPCRDGGDNMAPGILLEDFEGDPRIASGTVDMGADEFYTHLYHTGEAVPGGSVKIKITDLPGTSPLVLWIGSGVLDSGIPTPYGTWLLQFPVIIEADLGAVPAPNGVYAMNGFIPLDFPSPSDVALQVLAGDRLTNLLVIRVK